MDRPPQALESQGAAMKYLLLVTVFMGGQPPQSYQVQFSSAEACQNARNAVLADLDRMKAQQAREGGQAGALLAMQKTITAVCAAQ